MSALRRAGLELEMAFREIGRRPTTPARLDFANAKEYGILLGRTEGGRFIDRWKMGVRSQPFERWLVSKGLMDEADVIDTDTELEQLCLAIDGRQTAQ